MERFAALLGIPRAGPEVHNELIFKASPASTNGNVHENGRKYIGEIPPDVRARIPPTAVTKKGLRWPEAAQNAVALASCVVSIALVYEKLDLTRRR